MRKLSERLRIRPTLNVPIETEQFPGLDNLKRVQPELDHDRRTAGQEAPMTGISAREPADVARKLWCQAGHF